ncbi:extracellular matrix protein fras1-like [Plakobranchus ocellatus]|uniref:Extracellular matrix protein fras1-like n=1 Tax=Plakobranchus ocellatus TaxID=259542 RepID=A0AAV4CJR2_9GAST|nr:extracellular matrix protein fras1-like [Plakobranchus ocellatus]
MPECCFLSLPWTAQDPGSEAATEGDHVTGSFPLTDLLSGHVHYVQSEHLGKEPAWDAFLFSISDGINESSLQRLNISISLVNDEAPHIVSEQIYTQEGGAVTLTNASLYVTDLDTSPEELTFTLTKLPDNGQLVKKEFIQDTIEQAVVLRKKGTFTYEDVMKELVLYVHDDGETTRDSMTFDLTDGDFSETKTVNVIVGLVGDETPRVTINRGLRVKKGSTTVISNHDLKATDLDSEDPDIMYTIMRNPTSGQLVYREGKVTHTLTASGRHRTFQQRDIDAGYVSYSHHQDDLTGVLLFKFKLTDAEGNELIDQDFFITVVDDRLPPALVHKKELLVTEGGTALLTTDQLAFTDADSEPESLTYTVLSGPDLGHLELIGQSGTPIVTFTQTDLAASIVQYVHTSEAEIYTDKFTFMVSDGTNEIVQSFHIHVRPVDDVIPVVTSHGLRVQEGVRKVVTEFDLQAVDQDTNENRITFTVVEQPAHGSLDLLTPKGKHIPTLTFTMEDIYENRVSYQHDGSETTEDYFLFLVTDGTNQNFAMQQDEPVVTSVDSPQDFPITILPMDDGAPVLTTNLGLQFLTLREGEPSNQITSRELSASDEDTPPSDIRFVIIEPPQFGVLERTQYPGRWVSSFTQDDLENSKITYRLTDESPLLQDSFRFDLMDTKPNVLPDNVFHITWSEVSLGQSVFNTSETQGVLRVPVIRTGNLKQYAIVTCVLIPGSARSRTDVTSPGQQDFVSSSSQIQFEEWQESQSCPVIINDDSVFEGPEVFYVQLTSPTFALLGQLSKGSVTIMDSEDEPVLQFVSEIIHVNETNDYVKAVVERSGDVSHTTSVVCSTKSMSATGSGLDSLESGSDYISRGITNAYRVVFPPGLAEAVCEVKIIDDSLYENTEQFELELSAPSHPATLGPIRTSVVVIDGPNDESIIHMRSDSLAFPEDSGEMLIPVTRQGSDLSQSSSVWCHTRLATPLSAEPGEDYTPTSMKVTFGPGQTSQMCRVQLLDDNLSPKLEGNETLEVFLSAATGSRLEQPVSAIVVIYDQHLDLPVFSFSEKTYTVGETNGTLSATILRQGDITLEASVVCYTRQGSAQVMLDFEERPLFNVSRIMFAPGEDSKPCVVNIVDDEEFEADEEFLLRLISPVGPGQVGARLGEIDAASVTVTNDEDVPRVQIERPAYSIHEPAVREQVATVKVKVVRTGALGQPVRVRCSTRDGSAQSGSDYNPRSEILTFETGVAEQEFAVDVLYNSAVEWHEDFHVQLGPEDPTNARFGDVSMATITILDTEVSGSVILPAAPVVVSLLHFDEAAQGMKVNPSPGYPLVCLTPCDLQYPDYPTTSALCKESGINQSAIAYQWEVAMPASDEDVTPGFIKVTDKTLFTPVDQKVLDSIYFRPFFQIRCVAQPIHETGHAGVPLRSLPVTVGHTNTICKALPSSGVSSNHLSYQAQSFLASLKYVQPDQSDTEHANMVHISVQIPHQDGMLPLVSTFPLHNLRLLLAAPIYRQQHICSNIITARERAPLLLQHGFLGDSMSTFSTPDGSSSRNVSSGNGSSKLKDPERVTFPTGPGFDFPHQFDPGLRGQSALLLYKHLNLKTCTWQFDAWYHMTELLDLCGGHVVSDFQVRQQSKTYLTVRVPLHVSYVFATAPVGWSSLEHRTEMEVSFYYNSVLWQSGLETEGGHRGRLQVVRILIADTGKLLIEFRTHAKFRGLFLIQHPTLPGVTSRVVSTLTSGVTFDLKLVWSQATFDSPHQVWRATSNYNVKDYTGVYTVELIPCLVPATQAFDPTADPLPCTARTPERFEVHISFQQSNRPVPLSYSLNTEFHLSNDIRMFALDPAADDLALQDWDFSGTFARGEKLYGRVLWHPDQDLSSAYRLMLEKVYLCTGRDGYVPTYDPSGETYEEGAQFGCIQPSKMLLHRFLILDRENPDSTVADFQQVPFNARLISQVPSASSRESMPGVDGFVMDIDPLYKVDSGHQWHLQVVYTIGPADAPYFRAKRSTQTLPLSSQSQDFTATRLPRVDGFSSGKRIRKRRDSSSLPKEFHLRNNMAAPKKNTSGSIPSKVKSFSQIRNGTNMIALRLTMENAPQQSNGDSYINNTVVIVCTISLGLLLLTVSCIIIVCIRKRRRKRGDEAQVVNNSHLSTRNNLYNDKLATAAATVNVKSLQGHGQGYQGSEYKKSNIIKAKETNILSKQGVNVDTGTEV